MVVVKASYKAGTEQGEQTAFLPGTSTSSIGRSVDHARHTHAVEYWRTVDVSALPFLLKSEVARLRGV